MNETFCLVLLLFLQKLLSLIQLFNVRVVCRLHNPLDNGFLHSSLIFKVQFLRQDFLSSTRQVLLPLYKSTFFVVSKIKKRSWVFKFRHELPLLSPVFYSYLQRPSLLSHPIYNKQRELIGCPNYININLKVIVKKTLMILLRFLSLYSHLTSCMLFYLCNVWYYFELYYHSK